MEFIFYDNIIEMWECKFNKLLGYSTPKYCAYCYRDCPTWLEYYRWFYRDITNA